MHLTRILLSASLPLALVSLAHAQVAVKWIGKDGAWEDNANWQTNQKPPVNRAPRNGDRIDLAAPGVTITISAKTGTLQLDRSDAFQGATANVKILQTGGTVNIDQFLLSSTKAAVARGHANYELRGGTLYSDYLSTFTWDNCSDRASRFVQTGGTARFGATARLGLQMAQKSSTQQAYYELRGGTFDSGLLKLGSGGANQTVEFTQTGSSVATLRGTLYLGTVAGTTGRSVYKLHGGVLTMSQATNAFAFTQPGAPVYFDFAGGVLNLRGSWNFNTLTAIPNADFRVHGKKATVATLLFRPVTINGQSYTRIFECTAASGNYGAGLKGKNGVPTLTSSAPPRGGTKVDVTASNSSGAASTALVLVGVQTVSVDFLGGKLLVLPLVQTPFAMPATGLKLPYNVPRGFCTTFYLQVLQLDRAAVLGVAMTPGLKFTLGN